MERAAGVGAAMAVAYIVWFAAAAWRRNALFADAGYWRMDAALLVLALAAIMVGFRRSLRHARFAGVGLLVGTLALFVAALDVYALTLNFDSSGPGSPLHLSHQRWFIKYVQKNEDNFWERKVHPYYAYLPTDKYIIAAVGDSFTFGQGMLGVEPRFSNQVEKSLQARFGNKVDVLNYALGNGDTVTETAFVRDFVSRVHPDLAILFYLSNDIVEKPVILGQSRAFTRFETSGLIASPAFNYLYWRFVGPSLFGSMGSAYFTNLLLAYLDEERMQKHLADLANLFGTMKHIGAVPAMVILPFPHMWANVSPEVQAAIYERIRATAAAAGAPVLDLSPMEREFSLAEFQVNALDSHPSAKAHRAIAERVTAWILERHEFRQAINEATSPAVAARSTP